VDGGRIAKMLGEEGQHGLYRFRGDSRRGVVIQIDGFHGVFLSLLGLLFGGFRVRCRFLRLLANAMPKPLNPYKSRCYKTLRRGIVTFSTKVLRCFAQDNVMRWKVPAARLASSSR
jgi:hypothetical protein